MSIATLLYYSLPKSTFGTSLEMAAGLASLMIGFVFLVLGSGDKGTVYKLSVIFRQAQPSTRGSVGRVRICIFSSCQIRLSQVPE